MKQRNFKSPDYNARPNPIAKAMQTTRAFGTRWASPAKRKYNRAQEKRTARGEAA